MRGLFAAPALVVVHLWLNMIIEDALDTWWRTILMWDSVVPVFKCRLMIMSERKSEDVNGVGPNGD